MDCFASLAMTVKLSCPRMRVSSTPRLLDSITAASGILDRPPSRTMTAERTFAFSRRKLRPRLARKILPSNEREQGMPGACCTRGLVCNEWKRCAHEHTGTAGALRHSLRNGLTAYAVLSLETNSFCLHRCRLDGGSIRLDQTRHRQLDISHGCQNHTVLPYASAPVILRAVSAHG